MTSSEFLESVDKGNLFVYLLISGISTRGCIIVINYRNLIGIFIWSENGTWIFVNFYIFIYLFVL